MAPIASRVLLLAAGASGVLMDGAGDADAAGARGQRPRVGQDAPRTPSGRSYVYIAGVPGTGLDFWTGALRRCTEAQRCQPRQISFYTGLFFGREQLVNASWVQRDGQRPDRIVPMNLVSPDRDRQPDSAFYRAYASHLTGFEDPRLPLYHELAQSNGDGMKVMVLTRDNAKELTAYNMKKFGLNSEEADAKVAADIRTLAAQLRELPAESYRCMRFEEVLNLGSESLKPMVGQMGAIRKRAVSLKLQTMARKGMYGCGITGMGLDASFDCPHRHTSAPQVRAALDELEAQCDPADLVAAKNKQDATANSAEKIQWLVE